MKKQLLALAILSSAFAGAQTWSEDFTGATPPGLPAGWSQNNVDGLTVDTQLSAYSFGSNAWVTRDMSFLFPGTGNAVVSTSYYSPTGTSNDWLITPSFSVPANAVLEWDAVNVDASFPDGYQVKISTTGTTVASFTTNLLTVGAESANWNNRSLSLNAYAGQTVYIAFVNNSNDKFVLVLDNIKVIVPQVNDGNVRTISGIARYRAGAGTQIISGSFRSMGYSPATSAVLNYKVNNGSVTTQTFTFASPLNYGQSSNYSFTTPANLGLGVNFIKTWVTQVNSSNEVITTNDTAYTVVYVASTSKPRKALIEEWTSSTCVPCANLNTTFDPLLNGNTPNTGGNLNVIKYQVNWPSPGNDPSYNPHCLARRMHYDVNAAPTAIINGTSEMQNFDQAEIDAAVAVPAFADITATLSANGTTSTAAPVTVVATASITPYVTISANSPLRVYQAILQQEYRYNSATTTQKEYHHVMRRMTANGWGTPVNVTDGTTFTVNFTHNASAANVDPTPAQGSYNSWTTSTMTAHQIMYEYVVFVQDTISNDVLQSASWTASVTVPPINTTGIAKQSQEQSLSIYPNPAKDYAVLVLNSASAVKAEVSIYDITGKQVYAIKGTDLQSGKHELSIDTSVLAAGTYEVVVKTNNNAVLKEKLIVGAK